MTADIPSRELRNDVAGVLRRVAAGETLQVSVRGRPVATLAPVDGRPGSLRWSEFWSAVTHVAADPALSDELRRALPDTTDDVEVP